MSSSRSQALLADTHDSSFASLPDDDKLTSTSTTRRRRNFVIGCLIASSMIGLAVILSLYFLLARKDPEHIDPHYVPPPTPSISCPNTTTPAACLRDTVLPYYKLDAYIIPATDAHNSEYVAECDKRRQYISNFTGSAGTAIIVNVPNVLNRLFTDSRYTIQAGMQLDASEWTYTIVNTQLQWINATVPKHSFVGIDPTLMPASTFRTWAASLALNNITLVGVQQNLVDLVWTNRPPAPATRIMQLAIQQTGEEMSSKLQRIRSAMAQQRTGALVLSSLDSIAWTTNLRADDISFNPYFFSYLVLTPIAATLYVNQNRTGTPQSVWDYLAASNVTVRPYHTFVEDLPKLDADLTPTRRVWMSGATQAVYGGFTAANVYEAATPVVYMKSRKNPTEQAAMRDAHIKDSAAFVNLWDWLERRLSAGDTNITECTVADKIEEFRKANPERGFVELSYETIAGSGANGAIVHYDPAGTCSSVNSSAMLLLDSGGQYYNGTTDTTRTVHFGTPSAFEKTAFTLVLMGHIDQIQNVWTNGNSPTDWSARQPLLRAGLTYGHGTSHGVGDFLGVHEDIGGAVVGGVVTSVEPGFYHVPSDSPLNQTCPGYDRGFGIRIETDCVVVQHFAAFSSAAYWSYDPIVFVPMQTSLMRTDIMTDAQVRWVNTYHEQCRKMVSPLVTGTALQWLITNTQPINKSSTATVGGWCASE